MTVRTLRAAALVLALAACSSGPVPQAIEPGDAATCSLDDMLLADFPGPKGQIVYDRGDPEFFCDTVELVSSYLQPEQQRRVVAIYTQDMGKTAWERPRGQWIDAKSAFYVMGSRKTGSMGPTLATFQLEADAQAFAQANGGRVLRFSEITPAMVAVDGGVVKDGKM
jgi:copper chaperone NosL